MDEFIVVKGCNSLIPIGNHKHQASKVQFQNLGLLGLGAPARNRNFGLKFFLHWIQPISLLFFTTRQKNSYKSRNRSTLMFTALLVKVTFFVLVAPSERLVHFAVNLWTTDGHETVHNQEPHLKNSFVMVAKPQLRIFSMNLKWCNVGLI